MTARSSLYRSHSGAAATEMALVAPLLATIMFGSLELGKYYWDEHIVLTAVRDGARFAARQNFATMPCGGTATNEPRIKNLTRFGKTIVTGSDKPRLYYWTSDATVTVSITCYANAGLNGARVYNGIYTSRPVVPVVRVTAQVPYTPILGSFGFRGTGLRLNAYSEATVMGI